MHVFSGEKHAAARLSSAAAGCMGAGVGAGAGAGSEGAGAGSAGAEGASSADGSMGVLSAWCVAGGVDGVAGSDLSSAAEIAGMLEFVSEPSGASWFSTGFVSDSTSDIFPKRSPTN
jgi:hypothetical protein